MQRPIEAEDNILRLMTLNISKVEITMRLC